MKDTGLCIVYRNWNYGSILQSYATLVKLRSLGIQYEIIRYERKKNLAFYISCAPRLLNKDMLYSKIRLLKHKWGMIKHSEFSKNSRIRARKFSEFVNNYFDSFSEVVTSYDRLKSLGSGYRNIIVGSDQLWLPSGLATNFFNLMFAPDNVNKIAYSASFGVSSIPGYQIKRTTEYLNRIEHISVREESGQSIVKSLTGRDVPVILDPTMIITKKQWDECIPLQKLIEDDYIFCYFLGNNPDHREEARKLQRQTGLKIVVLRHLDEYIPSDETFGDIAPYDIGPAEFVNLIRYASYVCTDSFHGSVFSILYHKQFISFNRYGNTSNSRNSRLDTLFSNVGINRRFRNNIVDEMLQFIDYSDVEGQLEILRNEADCFIRNALI